MNTFNTHYSQKTPSKVRKEIQLMINLFRDLRLGTELASLRYFYTLKMNLKSKKFGHGFCWGYKLVVRGKKTDFHLLESFNFFLPLRQAIDIVLINHNSLIVELSYLNHVICRWARCMFMGEIFWKFYLKGNSKKLRPSHWLALRKGLIISNE